LMLARALYYCGDYNGLGESVLRRYKEDLRGYYSLQAGSILQRERQ